MMIIDNYVLSALAVIAAAAAAMFPKQILHALGQLWWNFVFRIDELFHDDEAEPCPDWADPEKWEASRI